MNKHRELHCLNCAPRCVPFDDEGLCQVCYVAWGHCTVADMLPPVTEEPHREPVTGQRLAAVIAAAACIMTQSEGLALV